MQNQEDKADVADAESEARADARMQMQIQEEIQRRETVWYNVR